MALVARPERRSFPSQVAAAPSPAPAGFSGSSGAGRYAVGADTLQLGGGERGYAVQGLCMILPSLMVLEPLSSDASAHRAGLARCAPAEPAPDAAPGRRAASAEHGAEALRGAGTFEWSLWKELAKSAGSRGRNRCRIRIPLEKLTSCGPFDPSVAAPAPAAAPLHEADGSCEEAEGRAVEAAAAAREGAGDEVESLREEVLRAAPPPPSFVLIGHAASFTPY